MSQRMSLDEIGLKYGTDKASSHHDYLRFYEQFLSPLREEKLNILEIGIFNGASLRMWEEYFSNSTVVGADINGLTRRFARDRVAVEILDQSNIEHLTQLATKHGPFDIIIEDGAHLWEHQITSLRTLFPFIKDNGLYIVEDLQTNYGVMEGDFRGISSISCVEYLKKWLDLRVSDNQTDLKSVEDPFLRTYGRSIYFMAFYRRACLIKKQLTDQHHLRKMDDPGNPLVENGVLYSSLRVSLMAHISDRGDVYGTTGFVNGRSNQAFQGLQFDLDQELLQYRVFGPDRSWSDWSETGEFAGTRGKSKLITGVTVRLRSELKKQYSVRLICRFVGHDDLMEVSDGEDIISASGNPIGGLQIWVSQNLKN
ncbi:class I SAM-dependent methyltransferase [Acidisphaera sp. S103]|uniref:class I SAM-dependent methyltransferase n=1 Tax=Acidisphaera sp. S103 TaxID=1747223 RepID=UPI00131CA50F|nr:class I SAM-dependent methyltransferase [Acidisphaera sp. S103]